MTRWGYRVSSASSDPAWDRGLTYPAAAFGIGTSLTNDFVKASDPSKPSKPLNIVIKLASIGGRPAVKLSDDKGKVRLKPRASLVAESLLVRSTQVILMKSDGHKPN